MTTSCGFLSFVYFACWQQQKNTNQNEQAKPEGERKRRERSKVKNGTSVLTISVQHGSSRNRKTRQTMKLPKA